MAGLMSLLGKAPGAPPSAPRGAGTDPARYAGKFDRSRTQYFAGGGMADPADEAPEVSPELKLAAYELLECLDSSRYSGPDGKVGRAEAFAKAMLAFCRLADEMPHGEGPHEGESEGEGEGESGE